MGESHINSNLVNSLVLQTAGARKSFFSEVVFPIFTMWKEKCHTCWPILTTLMSAGHASSSCTLAYSYTQQEPSDLTTEMYIGCFSGMPNVWLVSRLTSRSSRSQNVWSFSNSHSINKGSIT